MSDNHVEIRSQSSINLHSFREFALEFARFYVNHILMNLYILLLISNMYAWCCVICCTTFMWSWGCRVVLFCETSFSQFMAYYYCLGFLLLHLFLHMYWLCIMRGWSFFSNLFFYMGSSNIDHPSAYSH